MILDKDGDSSVVYFRYFLTKKAPVPCMKQGLFWSRSRMESHTAIFRSMRFLRPKERSGCFQYKSVQRKLERKHQHLANIKNDKANKLCHRLQTYKQVVIQDENLRGWHKGGHGKAVQHSILGRVKKKLKTMDNVTVLSRFAPTTKLCFHCGELHNEIRVWDRVFRCDCGVCMDRDIHAAQCMVWMYLNDFQIPTEHRNTMRAENKTSGKYSSRSDKKKTKSCSLKFEAHPL